MPKISVSVSDSLWEKTRTYIGPRKGPSQLIQDALYELTQNYEKQRDELRSEIEVAPERLEAIVEKVRVAARARFQDGYEAGLIIAETNSLEDWGNLAKTQFDAYRGLLASPTAAFLRAVDDLTAEEDELRSDALKRISEAVDAGYERVPVNRLFLQGAEAALQEIWETLEYDDWGVERDED